MTEFKKIETEDVLCRSIDNATGERLEASGTFTLIYMGQFQDPGNPEEYGTTQVLVFCNGKYSLVRAEDPYVGTSSYTLRSRSDQEHELWYGIR